MHSSRTDARLDQVRANLRDPLRWSEVMQLAKTVVAAVVAWVLASQVFSLPQAFLAPWAALLVVHATVYRTFSRGLRQVSGAVLGVLLAWGVGNVLGLTTLAVSVLLAVGLVVGSARWFRDESTAVAATGLIVLTTGFSTARRAPRRPALRHVHRHRGRAGRQPRGVAAVARLRRRPGHRRDRRRRGRAAARHRGPAAGDDLLRGADGGVGRRHARPRRGHRPGLVAAASGPREQPAQPSASGPRTSGRPTSSSRSCATTSRRSPSCAAWPARSVTASTA